LHAKSCIGQGFSNDALDLNCFLFVCHTRHSLWGCHNTENRSAGHILPFLPPHSKQGATRIRKCGSSGCTCEGEPEVLASGLPGD
jgi:hypothetical protein